MSGNPLIGPMAHALQARLQSLRAEENLGHFRLNRKENL